MLISVADDIFTIGYGSAQLGREGTRGTETNSATVTGDDDSIFSTYSVQQHTAWRAYRVRAFAWLKLISCLLARQLVAQVGISVDGGERSFETFWDMQRI